jgi:hypothetical protein
MATGRIESGQIQLRSVGGVPMQQPTMQGVDYVGFRGQAQAATTLSQLVDRMSQTAFDMAGKAVQERALMDVANNPLTPQQLEIAKNGDMNQLGIPGQSFNIYDAALRKARSFELSSAFDTEAKGEVVKVLADVEAGTMTSEKAAQKLNTLTKGFASSLAKVDGDAALKFTASMGVYAKTVMAEAYKLETKRTREKQTLALEGDFTNSMKLVEPTLGQGFYVDAEGQERPVEELLGVYRKNLGDRAFAVGGMPLANEYLGKFDKAVNEARVNAATKLVLGDEYMADANKGLQRIMAGDLGRMSAVFANMPQDEKIKVRDNFLAAVDARKKGIEANLYQANQKADAMLRQFYSSRNPSEQRSLFQQLSTMPVSPEKLKTARAFIDDQANAGRATDDLAAFGRVSQRVALGLATDTEIINGPFTNATKRDLMKAKSNPADDINFATNQINLAVGIQSGNLPPELKAPEARQLAVQTRNELVIQLNEFARTPNDKGVLPTPSEVRQRGIDLSKQASGKMAGAFNRVAESNKQSAAMMLPELSGVDLNNDAAVKDAFAKATARKASPTNISAARAAVDEYRANTIKAKEGQK